MKMDLKMDLKKFGRIGATLALVAAAAVAGSYLWHHYRESPWTRDGRVRADIVQVAPDVAGLVDEVRVHDNQEVHRGDVLFTIDRARYRLAVAQAEGALRGLRAQVAQTTRENRRNDTLGNIVSTEQREQGVSRLEQLNAAVVQATSALETARLNLARTEVKASRDGWVTNLDLRPGSYATVGRPVLAVIDRQSLHIVGYFEETKIPRIRVGDPVRVRLMGESGSLKGHVESIAAGIEDRERQGSSNLLANVNPTFNWVRLAQRIPVRVALDAVPADTRLIMGRTVTVDVVEGSKPGLLARGEQ